MALLDSLNTIHSKVNTMKGILNLQNSASLDDIISALRNQSSNIYLVNSIAERDALSPTDNTVCLIQESTSQSVVDETSQIGGIKYSNSITMSEPLVLQENVLQLSYRDETDGIYFDFRYDYTNEDYEPFLYINYINNKSGQQCALSMESSNKQTFTLNSVVGNIGNFLKFDTFVTSNYTFSSEAATMFNSLFTLVNSKYTGMYIYEDSTWHPYDFKGCTNPRRVYNSSLVTGSGLQNGTLALGDKDSISTIKDVMGTLTTNSKDNLTNCAGMFSSIYTTKEAHNVQSVVSSLDTSNVTSMDSMFKNMQGINTLDLSNFNTSNVTTMTQMFSGSDFQYLNLSNFNTNQVTNFSYMFRGMYKLGYLDISSFSIGYNATTTGMFNNIPATCIIIARDSSIVSKIQSIRSDLTNVFSISNVMPYKTGQRCKSGIMGSTQAQLMFTILDHQSCTTSGGTGGYVTIRARNISNTTYSPVTMSHTLRINLIRYSSSSTSMSRALTDTIASGRYVDITFTWSSAMYDIKQISVYLSS